MPEVMFSGPAGRLEGRFQPAQDPTRPIAILLHPFPQLGGSMDHPFMYKLYYLFFQKEFSVLRFNFRGVGRSQARFDDGEGELADAAAALDWAQNASSRARCCWVAGFSFGAWIGMQLLMRRPEIEGFICAALPTNIYDFSFLSPCPSSGLFIHGELDAVTPPKSVKTFVAQIKTRKSVRIRRHEIKGANHFLEPHVDHSLTEIGNYIDERMQEIDGVPVTARK